MFRAFSAKKGYSLSPEKDNEDVFGVCSVPGLPFSVIIVTLDVRASLNMTVLVVAISINDALLKV